VRDARWTIDPEILFLNHGSFGACPRAVLEVQAELRARLEREPVRFLARELGELWESARDALSSFVRCHPDGLVFVKNATTGVNTVLRSLEWKPGDQILMIDHGYSACLNAARYVAERTGAELVTAQVPFPIAAPEQAFDAICAAATPRTKLAVIDHITSPTGLVLPIERSVRELEGRGISVMVDGAHAPGMIDLDIESIGASWYTGNCHKWLCTPKGAALLWVREDKRELTRPLVISHGANVQGRDRFHREFDWLGTDDPTAVLCIPRAIEWLGAQLPGGWPALQRRNRELLIGARRLLLESWSIAPPCPESMLGTLAAIPLTDSKDEGPGPHGGSDSLHTLLFEKHRIEVPVYAFRVFPKRVLRIAAQLYNQIDEYETLARVVRTEL
jgi:isopenicillin-N epimerase